MRRLNGWFRGLRVGRAALGPDLLAGARRAIPEPSPFVALGGQRRAGGRGTYVDLGCGRGADALCMAERGEPSLGLDFQPRAFAAAERQTADNGLVTYSGR